jgi:hypothetical protein
MITKTTSIIGAIWKPTSGLIAPSERFLAILEFVVQPGEGDVVDAGLGAPLEGLGDELGVALLVGPDEQAEVLVVALAYLAWPVVASQEMLIRPAAALSSRFFPWTARGSWMFLSTFRTWAEVMDMKKTSSTMRTSIIGATWNSGSPSPPPPPPAMVRWEGG